ncbi:unnamed protein product [Acanthoscelides obtectus]|uniref:Uncharacterized protein n=1 Tax=Acanthoscelides obtectus TaxID=200917 RepID=A0A9P0KGT0_ACAOB|nr:unnamed protein product [Acanthoscelides obtectus]CAK1627854.1 hypothetical protein AOBTE_LOCUS4865 [Acanthoscelides obtectus]
MNFTTTEPPVVPLTETLHRQPRFGYIPLLAIFLSNLLSNTAVAKFIPLGSLRLSYDPLPLLRPASSFQQQYGSEESQHVYHHQPAIHQQQIVNILDHKRPTEIVVESGTEEPTESSTEHQVYRDDELEKPAIEDISDKSARVLFKRGIAGDYGVKSAPMSFEQENGSNYPKQEISGADIKYDTIRSSEVSKIISKRSPANDRISKNQYADQQNNSNFLSQDYKESSSKPPQLNLGKIDGKINRIPAILLVERTAHAKDAGSDSYETLTMKAGENLESQDMIELNKNITRDELEVISEIVTETSAENQDPEDYRVQFAKSAIENIDNNILVNSKVDSLKNEHEKADGQNMEQELRASGNGMKKHSSEIMSVRNMRALVKRGTANRYRVRKNNKYLYQKRRRVPDYYYDSYEDVSRSRYYHS